MNPFATSVVKISSAERLVTTLFFAILLHGTVILGISFSGEEPSTDRGTTLEITLVHSRSTELPDKADYLAEANQRGAGNTREQARPESALSSPDTTVLDGAPDAADWRNHFEASNDEETPDSLEAPTKQTLTERQVVTRSESDFRVASEATSPSADTDRVLVARLMTPGQDSLNPVNENTRDPVARSDEIREKVISVNTRESVYAEYLDAWRRRVETVGNRHYPQEARAQGIQGSLVLEVALNADGTIRSLDVRKPSEHPVFDEAAIRILRLASPFDPFSDAMQQETDVLRFVYEWRFGRGETQGSVRINRDRD